MNARLGMEGSDCLKSLRATDLGHFQDPFNPHINCTTQPKPMPRRVVGVGSVKNLLSYPMCGSWSSQNRISWSNSCRFMPLSCCFGWSKSLKIGRIPTLSNGRLADCCRSATPFLVDENHSSCSIRGLIFH